MAARCLAAAAGVLAVIATVVATAAIVGLPKLGGSSLLKSAGLPVYTVCSFEGH